MAKKNKIKHGEKVPKVAELVSTLSTFMDSETDYGADFGMTRLSKEIELKNGNPHVNTVRNKLTEFFLMRDALRDWEPVWKVSEKSKILDRVRKEEPKEINMATISDMLINIQKDLDSLKQKKQEQ